MPTLEDATTPTMHRAISPLRIISSVLGFLFRSTSELARVSGEIHHVVSDKPRLVNEEHPTDIEQAPKLYRLIQLLLIRSANQLHAMHNQLNHYHPPALPPSDGVKVAQSILNGVMGDKLNDWQHPSAINMHLLDEHHQPIHLETVQANNPKGVAIFVHGLCLSEHGWRNQQSEPFINALKATGITPLWLRYNTGLGISENGALLDQLLASTWDEGKSQQLLFIGHSMGGLVARSAIYCAEHHSQQGWLNSVTHAAYLASPHEGAKMEKLGHMANSILGYSPYTKPLMSLGNIRSRGIRSLRHSNIEYHEEDRPYAPNQSFNPNIKHLMIGARLPDPIAHKLLGDGLVTDTSAMGISHFPIDNQQVSRLFIDNVGHMKLLSDKRLYGALTLWLATPSETE